MSRSRKYRPVVVLRRALLAALALFFGVVVAIFINNRMNSAGEGEGETESGIDSRIADVILSGKGFDYEVTDGQDRLFHIRADRILTDRDNVVTLEGVLLTVEREVGETYSLKAKSGRYETKSNNAVVEGKVILSGPDGVKVRGPRFLLQRKGTVVKSRRPVRFSADGGLSGSASELEAHLKRDEFQLLGDVRIVSENPTTRDSMELTADRIVYDEAAGLIHAEGNVRMVRGRDELTCRRLAVTLSDGNSRPTFVRARLDVKGKLVNDDRRGFERRTRFAGDTVSLAYDPDTGAARIAEIIGSKASPARLDQGDDSGWVRRFETRRIEADFRDGQIAQARSDSDVSMTEFLGFDPGQELARVCGTAAVAEFDAAGDLSKLEIQGRVDLHRAGLQTVGEKLVAYGDERIEVEGGPAIVYTEDGELSAPELAYRVATGELEAEEGVRAWLPPEGDFQLVGANQTSGDAPIQVTSETARWKAADGEFQFEGDVRAWQGESFLTAAKLIGRAGGQLDAQGGVKTVLEREAPPDAEGETEAEESGPVEVTSDTMEYRREDKTIFYRGAPEVREAGRLMTCDDLQVVLGEDSRLSSLLCAGNAVVDDRIGGRKLTGNEALYLPNDSSVEVTGSPVILTNPDGGQIRAGRVLYDLETAQAEFQSASTLAATAEANDG